MSDGRRRTVAQKARTRRARLDRASKERRTQDWWASSAAAEQAGLPLNMTLTAIWGAVDAAAASNENGAVWRRMRRFMERRGLPWVALRAPEFAPRKGHHLHLVFHCPDKVIRDVICLVEDITGEQAAWFNEQGRRLGWMKGIVAKSVGPDWMLQRHLSEHGPNDALIGYVAKGSGKARAAGRHQRSQALIELEKSA